MYAKPSKDKPMPQSSHWTPGVSCPHGLHRGLLTISLSILFRLLRDHLDSAFRWSCLSMSSLSRDERGWGFAHHLVSSGIVFDFNFKFFLRYLFTDWISYIYICSKILTLGHRGIMCQVRVIFCFSFMICVLPSLCLDCTGSSNARLWIVTRWLQNDTNWFFHFEIGIPLAKGSKKPSHKGQIGWQASWGYQSKSFTLISCSAVRQWGKLMFLALSEWDLVAMESAWLGRLESDHHVKAIPMNGQWGELPPGLWIYYIITMDLGT